MFFPTAVGLTLVVIAAASPAWSQPPQVTLCHKGKTTLTLPVPAAAAHIAQHGDTLGPCGCGPCIADDDCPAGTGCNAADVCVPWCACPECDVCAGFCVE
jgi:hypothetical protein